MHTLFVSAAAQAGVPRTGDFALVGFRACVPRHQFDDRQSVPRGATGTVRLLTVEIYDGGVIVRYVVPKFLYEDSPLAA
jgi:hypothetical protein